MKKTRKAPQKMRRPELRLVHSTETVEAVERSEPRKDRPVPRAVRTFEVELNRHSHASEMEQAEGDLDIIEQALENEDWKARSSLKKAGAS